MWTHIKTVLKHMDYTFYCKHNFWTDELSNEKKRILTRNKTKTTYKNCVYSWRMLHRQTITIKSYFHMATWYMRNLIINLLVRAPCARMSGTSFSFAIPFWIIIIFLIRMQIYVNHATIYCQLWQTDCTTQCTDTSVNLFLFYCTHLKYDRRISPYRTYFPPMHAFRWSERQLGQM